MKAVDPNSCPTVNGYVIFNRALWPVLTFFFHKKQLSFTFPTNQIARFTPDKSETGCAKPAGGVAISPIRRAA